VQEHVPEVPPSGMLHVCPLEQVPQEIVQPQPSGAVPQLAPERQVLSPTHPQLWVPQWSVQVTPGGHTPQLIVPPHPSGAVPHCCPAGHTVRGTHATHCPPLHTSLFTHTPQLIVPPHPSGATPQFWPVGQFVAGWQTRLHMPKVLPSNSSHVCPPGQGSHCTTQPQPSGATPQTLGEHVVAP
jgi:hypothetical protein